MYLTLIYVCLQAKNTTTFALSSGPPGPSPYALIGGGMVVGSRFAQHPPSSVAAGLYLSTNLGTGLETPKVCATAAVEVGGFVRVAFFGCYDGYISRLVLF
jgi:hypothetical protein